jgi:hypothetical protein
MDSPSTGFQWMPGGGDTWAFEVVMKFAPGYDGGVANGGNNESFWSSGGWSTLSGAEMDMPEHWGYNGPPSQAAWVTVYNQTGPSTVSSSPKDLGAFLGADPSAAFHRYTTLIAANGAMSVYVDGRLFSTAPAPPSLNRVWQKLLISYALRNPSAPNPRIISGFTSGSRDFIVRSVVVYQDTAHLGQSVLNGVVAPGTVVAGRHDAVPPRLRRRHCRCRGRR